MIRVHVDTAEYRFAHGKEPRGHGGWWFFVRGADGKTVDQFQMVDVYSKARRRAARRARNYAQVHAMNEVDLVVGS